MRRLLILTSTIIFFDVTFFTAITPLLPHYVSQFDLSKAGAGVLASAYSIGTLLASLPAGYVATRVGPRRTVIGGLLLLGVSSMVFGFGENVVLLDVTRFTQGIGGAMLWAGAMAWLITTAPPERRGSLIGTTLGMAVAGALVGPFLGGIAAEIGTEVVFSAVLAIAIALAVIASRLPDTGPQERQPGRDIARTILSRPILSGALFVVAPSMMLGAEEVLVPLRIDDFGGSAALIAGSFIASAGVEALLAPISGRYSDKTGRRKPYLIGMAICAVGIVGIGVGQGLEPVIAALVLGAVGAGIGFTPVWTSLSEAADATRLHQGYAAALSNMSWSAGQVGGALAGGGIASVAGYAAPCIAIAAFLVLTAGYAYSVLSPSPAQSA